MDSYLIPIAILSALIGGLIYIWKNPRKVREARDSIARAVEPKD